MKNRSNKNKTREPFKPENTPEPPQRKNPNEDNEQKNQPPVNQSQQKQPQDTGRRLGESPLEIEDETTI